MTFTSSGPPASLPRPVDPMNLARCPRKLATKRINLVFFAPLCIVGKKGLVSMTEGILPGVGILNGN